MILITGATGLLGGHLLYRFRESATQIIVIFRTESSKDKVRRIFESYDKESGHLIENFNWVKADILDVPSLNLVFNNVKQVYHCAAAIEANNFEELEKINVIGTANVINTALHHNVEKFCHVSSIAALGDAPAGKPTSEEDFFNLDALNSDYAITKYGAEMEAWRATQEGMKVIIVNPGVILGEGDFNSGSGKLISRTAGGNKFYTTGSSGFIDVRDVVHYMVNLMESDVENERFILVSNNLNYKTVLDQIAGHLKVKKPNIKLSAWFLQFLSILSQPIGWLGGSSLTSATVKSLTSETYYSNDKIKAVLPNYETKHLDQTIQRVTTFYKNLN